MARARSPSRSLRSKSFNTLNQLGVPDDKITVIIAVGAHRCNTEEEFVEICGNDVCHRIRVINHDAFDEANMVYHRVCFDAEVIHGAIGWTAEMDISLYLLRPKDLENNCGGSDFHKERIASELEKSDPEFLMIEA